MRRRCVPGGVHAVASGAQLAVWSWDRLDRATRLNSSFPHLCALDPKQNKQTQA